MQRAAQQDDRATGVPPTPLRQEGNDQRARRLRRALVCAAAVPAVLITAACSADSGDGDKGPASASARPSAGGGSATASPDASPTLRPATYGTLPAPCGVLSKKTLTDLVPQGVKSGKQGSSDDPSTRSSCSWSSLDNNGVKGSQFRWLNVSLLRFGSDTTRGSGDSQAHAYYAQQVKDVQAVDGAKKVSSEPVTGAGDEATAVRYDLKKKEGAFKQQTVVTRVANVVITVDYNGAGLAGEETPDAGDLTKAAQKASKEVAASVAAANGKGSGAGSAPASPGKSASASPSESSSKPASASASAAAAAAGKTSGAPSAGASASKSAVRRS